MMSILLLYALYFSVQLLETVSQDILQLNLTNIGYNYALSMYVADQPMKLIVDTGNHDMTIQQYDSSIGPREYNSIACLTLYEDSTYVYYFSENSSYTGYCNLAVNQSVSLVDTSFKDRHMLYATDVEYTLATNISIVNPTLHPWTSTQGNLGLAYCHPTSLLCQYNRGFSVFENMLLNYTNSVNLTSYSDNNNVVGLDFNAQDTSSDNSNYLYTNTSSMQIGGILSDYSSDIVWARQATSQPFYHRFVMRHLEMCGPKGVDLMRSVGSSYWPVLVDTGQVCLQLPDQIYDSVYNWLGTIATDGVTSLAALPTLSFQVDGGVRSSLSGDRIRDAGNSAGDYLYIPLSSLLINDDNFNATEVSKGALSIPVGSDGDTMSFCMLKSGSIYGTSTGGSAMADPPPNIVLGSLVLRSLYFAADYGQKAVGLANKANTSTLSTYYDISIQSSKCAASERPSCIGQQYYSYSNNQCKSPRCHQYFFAELDTESQYCEYKLGTYNAGMFFLSLIIIFEVVSYFVMQYSSLQVLGYGEGEENMSRIREMNTEVDSVTRYVGMGLTYVVDFVVVNVLHWAHPHRD